MRLKQIIFSSAGVDAIEGYGDLNVSKTNSFVIPNVHPLVDLRLAFCVKSAVHSAFRLVVRYMRAACVPACQKSKDIHRAPVLE
jgi:hypothetical protein